VGVAPAPAWKARGDDLGSIRAMPGLPLPGAEPFAASNGPHGVLVLHGFTGCPQSMRPLAEAFADAGFSVDLPLLPGHGTAVADLVPMRFADWFAAADVAYQELAARCDRMVVAGLSMGGTLTLHLARRYPELAGAVVINPLVAPPAESFRDVLTGALAAGVEVAPAIGSDIKKEGAAELAYDGAPIEAVLSLFDAVAEMAEHLEEIRCPVLLLQSRDDHVVPGESGDLLVDRVGGPIERVWLEESFHVATLDNDQHELEDRAVAFAQKSVAG
jgi:carboxylesterase